MINRRSTHGDSGRPAPTTRARPSACRGLIAREFASLGHERHSGADCAPRRAGRNQAIRPAQRGPRGGRAHVVACRRSGPASARRRSAPRSPSSPWRSAGCPAPARPATPISAIRAGLLTFLAALHGGVVVDGTSAQFLPLGPHHPRRAWSAGEPAAAWPMPPPTWPSRTRAGSSSPHCCRRRSFTAAGADRRAVRPSRHQQRTVARRRRRRLAAVRRSAVASPSCGPGRCANVLRAAVPASVRPRRPRRRQPRWPCMSASRRCSSPWRLVLHAGRVEEISRQLGGGWSGIPVLLLGVLAAPNAVIAALAYLLGPGFAIGAGATVSVGSGAHGVVPAFPLLGALPHGRPTPSSGWPSPAPPLLAGLARRRGVLWRGPTAGAMARRRGCRDGVFRLRRCSCWPGRAAVASARDGYAWSARPRWRTGAFGAVALAIDRHLSASPPAASVALRPLGRLRWRRGAAGGPVADTGDQRTDAPAAGADPRPSLIRPAAEQPGGGRSAQARRISIPTGSASLAG